MKTPFVQKLERYAALSAEDVAAISSLCSRTRQLPARRDLAREGDKPGPFFVFIDGWGCRSKLVLSGQRQVVALLMPGDSCDIHAAALSAMDHTIQTLTTATVADVPRAELDRAIDERPNIARALYVSQLVDEATARAWIVSMGRRTSHERVAHLMCELYLRAINVGNLAKDKMKLPLTQVMLADALGMTAVHINRVLRDLRLDGAMEISRGSLTITDLARLTAIAGFDENYLHRRTGAG